MHMTRAWYASRLFLQVESIMREALRYWTNAAHVAERRAWEFIGWGHPVRIVPSTAIWAFTTLVFYLAFHDSKEIEVNMEWAVSGLLAAIALYAVVWLFEMFIVTPPRLAREAVERSQSQADEANDKCADKDRQIVEIKRGAGEIVGRLRSELAAINETLKSPLRVEKVEDWGEGNLTVSARLVVHNDSPKQASGVQIVINSIDVQATQDPNTASELIDRLQGTHLLERTHGDCVVKKQFYFLAAEKDHDVAVYTQEFSHKMQVSGGGDYLHSNSRNLPQGIYRFNLLVTAIGRGSRNVSYTVTTESGNFGVIEGQALATLSDP
jgi:hypothetical protein